MELEYDNETYIEAPRCPKCGRFLPHDDDEARRQIVPGDDWHGATCTMFWTCPCGGEYTASIGL